ncbi:MAG: MerR family transcriptional regulator [Oscillospiraceae bacterium]|jgi:DNA-binding transcriptional MerR regulator
MRIQEVEKAVGITKKNIRFYESQGLLHPDRESENGYRSYSPQDVAILQRIKLMRKLGIPIEEIRQLQAGNLTLSDCMDRHLIYLNRESENIRQIYAVCQELSASQQTLEQLDLTACEEKIRELEEGGVQFMSVKNDKRKKMVAPIIVTVLFITLFIGCVFLFLWGNSQEALPIPLLIFLLFIPVALIAGVLIAVIQRIREIEKGEEDEASKY